MQKIKDFFKGSKTSSDILNFLPTIALFQGDAFMLAFEAIIQTTESDSVSKTQEINVLTDNFSGIANVVSQCVEFIKSSTNNNAATPEQTLTEIVNLIFDSFNVIHSIFNSPANLLHLIPQTIMPIKFLSSTLSAVAIKINEHLGSIKDSCQIAINVKDHFQPFLLERFKLIKMTYNFEPHKWTKCSIEQRILDASFDSECPSNYLTDRKCKVSKEDYYDLKDELSETGKELKKDLFLSKDDFYYGKPHSSCAHYYLCRVRDKVKQAFKVIHE